MPVSLLVSRGVRDTPNGRATAFGLVGTDGATPGPADYQRVAGELAGMIVGGWVVVVLPPSPGSGPSAPLLYLFDGPPAGLADPPGAAPASLAAGGDAPALPPLARKLVSVAAAAAVLGVSASRVRTAIDKVLPDRVPARGRVRLTAEDVNWLRAFFAAHPARSPHAARE